MVDAGVSAIARLAWLRDEVDLWEGDRMSAPTPFQEPVAPLIYGGGRCAVCKGKTRANTLMCPRHWGQVPSPEREAVNDCLRRWKFNACTLAELRLAQEAAIEAVTGKPWEGSA
jgi:hypothetical protein